MFNNNWVRLLSHTHTYYHAQTIQQDEHIHNVGLNNYVSEFDRQQ